MGDHGTSPGMNPFARLFPCSRGWSSTPVLRGLKNPLEAFPRKGGMSLSPI